MENVIYETIRKENEKSYGDKVGIYGVNLADKLYSDRTHFIYELIQNAEDASKRSNKEDKNNFFISFTLYPDRLEVRNNGALFNHSDIKAICNIGDGTKKNDLDQIGKFGLGFKSVYAYTTLPEVHSGDKSFYIKNYVHPYEITNRPNLNPDESLFVIPFNHNEISKEKSNYEIKQRLRTLGNETLLFLRYIKEIKWYIGNEEGIYYKQTKNNSYDIRTVDIISKHSNIGIEDKLKEKYLIFEEKLEKCPNFPIEIAYKLHYDESNEKLKIVPINEAKLSVFFLTNVITGLKFIIQGPYITTPARNDIRLDEEWNKDLIEKTSILVSNSISRLKELNLLSIGFLNTLPLSDPTSNNLIYKPIFDTVLKKMNSNQKLLPTSSGEYTNSKNAVISRTDDLRQLISSEQINDLFSKQEGQWISQDITRDRENSLFRYLTEKLNIQVVDPEYFSRRVSKEFFEKQEDQWLIEFYNFLFDKPALWKSKDSTLRNKEILRLENNVHVKGFDFKGDPVVYISGDYKIDSPTIKNDLLDSKTKSFLIDFGLREPDLSDCIDKGILVKYSSEGKPEIQSYEENKTDVELIFKILNQVNHIERKRLIEQLKITNFLRVKDQKFNDSFKQPSKIYLGNQYTNNSDLEDYFEGEKNIYFLDHSYSEMVNLSVLKEIGCKDKIPVIFKEGDSKDYVILEKITKNHKRGLNGFDPKCEILGLLNAIQNINFNILKIL